MRVRRLSLCGSLEFPRGILLYRTGAFLALRGTEALASFKELTLLYMRA